MNRSEKIRAALAQSANQTAREIAKAIGATDEEVKFVSAFLSTSKEVEFTEKTCSVTGRTSKAYSLFGAQAAPKAPKAPLPGNGPRCEDQPHKEAPKAAPAPKPAPKAHDPHALLKLDPTGMIRSSLPDNASHTHRFEILSQSSDRIYIVAKARRDGQWQCGCPGWIHHRHCKHLAALVPFLKAADKEIEKLNK